MGIMDKMRQKMGIILIILLVAFVITIVFDWGAGGVDTFMSGSDVVGVVDGEKITLKDFYEAYNAALEQYRRAGVELDIRTTEMIVQQTWETIVNQTLWEKEIERMNIAISDEELFHHLENNPPEFLKTQEVFLTEGQFDKNKYLNILYNPQGNEWIEIENYLRFNILPYQKLNDIILTSVVVDEQEVLQGFIDRYTSFTAEYIAAPVRMIPDSLIVLHEEDLKAYYNAYRDDLFKKEEERHIRLVTWPKIPSAGDSATVMREIENIILRHNEGESFQELAEIFSEVPDESMLGDLGWISREDLRREYRGPVLNGETGEILDPVIIGDEYHLIKITEKNDNDNSVRLSLIVRRIDPLNTYNYYASEAEAFIMDVEAYGFAKAFENTDARLDTVRGGFSKDFPLFGNAGYLPALARWAYNSKSGELSHVFENETAFVVAELFNIIEASYLPFNEVKPQIERSLLAEKKKEKSSDIIIAAREAFLQGDSDMKETAEKDPLIEHKTITFSLENPPYPFAAAPVFTDIVRNASLRTYSHPFPAGNYGYAILRLTNQSPIDTDLFAEKREDIRDRILSQKQEKAFENWVASLREKAVIKDYREKFGLN